LFKSVICAALLAALSGHAAAATALKFGELWDGRQVLRDAMVVVEGDKVVSVTAHGKVPAGAKVVDLSRYAGIPGLIDAHTHMTYVWDPAFGETPLKQKIPPGARVFLAQRNAMRTLEAGVTTVRDLGASGGADIGMRDVIAKGFMKGPRMFVAGQGFGAFKGKPGVADPLAEAKKQVAARAAEGVNWIKVYGSTGSFDDVTGDETVSFEEMKTMADAAHAAGLPIAIHSYGPVGARDAIRAGADTLEHATDMDDATIAEMVARKVWYVPTIDHNQYYLENADSLYKFKPEAKANLADYIARNFATAKKAHAAGARMVVGSDAVFTGFGQNMRELRWFVKLGMSNAEALQSATVLPAEMLGMKDKLGVVAPGAFADIVAVEGDPLADVGVVIDKVRWVMKGGEVVVDKRRAGPVIRMNPAP
jgi:imidazolonepropionase-like amidohydrolase